VRDYEGSAAVADMLAYHFGFGAHGPARRGKRLRPQMLVRVALSEGAPIEHALDAAAAIELLHNYSLVHDDIEDNDEMRHGRRTLWNVYGIAQALNTGDAMCALSFLTLANAKAYLGPAQTLEVMERLQRAHRVMCDGQAMDIGFERAENVAFEDYRTMIACKTAALFKAACSLGALCAGADLERVQGYVALGYAYGMAFQVRDDVLGVWASADHTGKAVANDIVRRKWSFPIVWALAQDPSPARETIAQAYRAHRALHPEEVERVVAALNELGAREAAEREVAEHLAVVERHPNGAIRDFLLETLAAPVG
jgi:geranylgeranyl diphosphate synthase, type I